VYALSQELETTIGQIDGVVVARVHVVLPEKVGPGEPVQPPSAAVFIKHLPTLEPDTVSYRIRQLVARSIPGMGEHAIERVSAVFIKADVLPERAPPPPDHTLLWSLLALIGLVAAGGGAVFFMQKRGFPTRPVKSDATGPASTITAA
jgi:type III secretory pathway lipoprotein EscJ